MPIFCFFFFNDTATTEIYTLSLHDALPISGGCLAGCIPAAHCPRGPALRPDRKSTRLNSSHSQISYAVFCLKKKKNIIIKTHHYITLHTQFGVQFFSFSTANVMHVNQISNC